MSNMNLDIPSSIQKIQDDIKIFLQTGDNKVHQRIIEQLGVDGNEISYRKVERLLQYLEQTRDKNTQIFIANGIKQIVKLHYSVFESEQKNSIYSGVFAIYKHMPQNTYFLQDLLITIFNYFYDSIQLEVSFIEDVKQFCEQSVEHLQLGLQLFSNIVSSIQHYQLKYKTHSYIDYNSELTTFHRKIEISFRLNLLPQIFDIPFQLLNTKREDLMTESETNFSVLLEVLNLLYECLNYDYFDQKKVTDEKFVVDSSILSIPCREKKSDQGYLNDLKSQEFTNTLFELYYYMINKHKEISIKCLLIISLLSRLSIKFFKKEDQKFSQMMFIIEGLHKIMQTHTFIFQESDVAEQTQDIFQAFCSCVSKIPIGLSFSDGENLQGFWDFVVDVQKITKIAIERRSVPCLELLLEFWCGYDYFLGHDGAQKQEQLRSLVEKILKQFIKSSIEMVGDLQNDSDFEETIDQYQQVIRYFGQLANTWIDQIEEILMKRISEIFQQQGQLGSLQMVMRKKEKEVKEMKSIYYQMYWVLYLLFKAQSYNIKEELSMTNKHYELDQKEEIKEDIDILYQAFESFAKLFQIVLNLFKQQETQPLPQFLSDLILEILLFLIDYVLAYKNHINFDYLCIIIKFTDILELKNYFYLNYVIVYFLDQFCCSTNIKNITSFQRVLQSITSNLKATDQGMQIGCFSFDLQGFFESETYKRHKESGYDNLSGKQIQKIYQSMFVIIDKNEQQKKLAQENDFQSLVEKLNQQKIQEDNKIESNVQKSTRNSKNNESNNNNNQNEGEQGKIRRSVKDQANQQERAIENEIIEIDCMTNSKNQEERMKKSMRVSVSQCMVQPSSLSYSQVERVDLDYFGQFMNVISFRIQLDEHIPISEQKIIFRNVLNQLVGIVRSVTMHTYTQFVQFVLANNIFYSIKQVIKQEDELNAEEINSSLKFISELASRRIYLSSELQELLLKEVVEIIIATQSRLLNKSFLQNNIHNDSDEWNLLVLPLSYQYRIIFNLLQQGHLHFSQVDSQMTISNMFHCLSVITPEKMSQYHKKLYWIYRSIHLLSHLHFEVFLFLQPLEFHSVTQIMEEALKVSFDSEEPMDFFINVLNQIFICKKTNNLTMNQYLAYSEETLIKVLQAIVLKVLRHEDLTQKNLHRLMLGYYWMLEKDLFTSTVISVINNFPFQNQQFINKFLKYADEIEILDFKKYQYLDPLVLLDAKVIFKKIFV